MINGIIYVAIIYNLLFCTQLESQLNALFGSWFLFRGWDEVELQHRERQVNDNDQQENMQVITFGRKLYIVI